MEKSEVEKIIRTSYSNTSNQFDESQKKAIHQAIEWLDKGVERVSYKTAKGDWLVNEWLKEAILLYFRITPNQCIQAGQLKFFDKIPLKQWDETFGVRVVPQAIARYGSYIEKNVILMPSFVNIGAYVATGTMVDTWATVGSCAQIGQHVHLSGGVGIGGVLEPIQAQPVIIEDHVFVGSRCVIVEGLKIGSHSVLGAGVTLTASTPIIDVSASETKTFKGWVPPNSIVIPGTRKKAFPGGEFSIPCALIIGKRTESTDKKTSLTQALRDFEVSV